MFKKILIIIGVITASECSAQVVTYDIKLMAWNILNFPSTSNFAADTTQRCPAYREVVGYAQPDILITNENTSTSSPAIFLNQVMNTGSYHYASGTYINGFDTDNAIFYRDSLFDFIGNYPVQTSLRDINRFTLVFKATGDTVHIFSCHLKAGQGDEFQRASEVAALRQVTNGFPAGSNFLIGGDFNIYESNEPAYIALLADNANDDGNFLDPIQLTGVWNQFVYAQFHTQSTHFNSSGIFVGGGMDDRFDMILYSNAIAQPTGVYYVPGSYINIGNDGNHFNDDINYGTNTAVPLAVADALFDASDHLPVMLTLRFGPVAGIDDIANLNSTIDIYPSPVRSESKVRCTLTESA